MKQIELTRGLFALVDDPDFDSLSGFAWIATPSQHGWRAYRKSLLGEYRIKRTIYMHQQIMGFPPSEVDHRNRNGLDNRRSNLRLATRSQQAANSEWQRPNGFRGIVRNKKAWCARITVQRKEKHLGSFQTKVEAAKAYDLAARAAFGEFAVLNFPRTFCTPTPQPARRGSANKPPSRMKGPKYVGSKISTVV